MNQSVAAQSPVWAVIHILSLLVMLFGLVLTIPLLFSLIGPDLGADAFLKAAGLTFAIGAIGALLTQKEDRELQTRDGFLLVILVWTVLVFFAALPFWFFFPELSFPRAYFEAMSGLTTTGATSLTGLDQMPRSILFWRGFLQWIGGMGILVLAVAVLPLLGVGGMQIYKAEMPGPMKESKLTPRIAETAKGLWGVYLILTVSCFLAYWWAGMNWFDALVHTGTTVAIGGFSNYDASFGYFNSPLLEGIAIVLMLLAGVNFAMHFVALKRLSLRPYLGCPEARCYLLAVVWVVGLSSLYLWLNQVYPDFLTSLRHAAFNVVSVVTTTGYATQDYSAWPLFLVWLMILFSAFATSSGSTGGGVKMIRLVIMFKQGRRELARIVYPRAIDPVQLNGSIVGHQVLFATIAFMLFYGATVMVATFLLLLSGMNDITAISAVLASINCLGPGLNEVGPAGNYSSLTDFQLSVLTVTMLMGRLELLTLLVILLPSFWRR